MEMSGLGSCQNHNYDGVLWRALRWTNQITLFNLFSCFAWMIFFAKNMFWKNVFYLLHRRFFFTEQITVLLFFTHKTSTGGEKINLVKVHTANRKVRELKWAMFDMFEDEDFIFKSTECHLNGRKTLLVNHSEKLLACLRSCFLK